MRIFAFFILLFASTFCWAQKPEWLKIDPNGHSLFIQGLMNDREDTTLVLKGTITIYLTDRPKESYTINANSLGVFQFHLRENEKYTASFENQGYVSRKIQFDTQNVPDKSWKKGCDLYLNVQMDQRPEGFKDMVAELPFATFRFDIDERIFLFDLEETNRVLERYNEELDRAKGVTK
jgi:hypothetical protein